MILLDKFSYVDSVNQYQGSNPKEYGWNRPLSNQYKIQQSVKYM